MKLNLEMCESKKWYILDENNYIYIYRERERKREKGGKEDIYDRPPFFCFLIMMTDLPYYKMIRFSKNLLHLGSINEYNGNASKSDTANSRKNLIENNVFTDMDK